MSSVEVPTSGIQPGEIVDSTTTRWSANGRTVHPRHHFHNQQSRFDTRQSSCVPFSLPSEQSIPLLRDALTADGLVVGQDDPRKVAVQIKNRNKKLQSEIVAALYEWYSVLAPPIGVCLSDQDPGLITYVSPYSPAGRDGFLKTGHRIVGVGQGTGGSLTRTAGMTTPQIRQLLRGESGSIVRLEVLPANATQSRTLEIPRDTTAVWLWAAIQAIDPDPWRRSVREACQLEDEALRLTELEKLVDEADLAEEPVRFLNQLGAELMRANAIDRATNFLKEVWQRHPADVTTNMNLAICLRANKPPQNDESLRYYTTVVALRPDSRRIRNFRGYVLNLLGKHEEAIADFRAAIQLAPNHPDAHYNLGVVMQKQDKLEEAVAEYHEAIRLSPDAPWSAEVHNNLGVALCRVGELDKGIAEFREAIRITTENSSDQLIAMSAHENLGHALHNQGKLEEAIVEYREAIRGKPENADAHYGLGVALHEQGSLDEAIAEWREAVRLMEETLRRGGDEVYGHSGFPLSIAHWRLGHYDEAQQYYDKSAKWLEENDLGDVDLKRLRAEAAELLGIPDELAPNSPDEAQTPQ